MPWMSFSQTDSDEMDALLDDVGNANQLDICFQKSHHMYDKQITVRKAT